MTLLEALIEIRDEQRHEPIYGICLNAEDNLRYSMTRTERDAAMCRLYGAMMLWPKYSGWPRYPVPHPVLEPENAFYRCDLWDKATEYGQARWELLDFLIGELS